MCELLERIVAIDRVGDSPRKELRRRRLQLKWCRAPGTMPFCGILAGRDPKEQAIYPRKRVNGQENLRRRLQQPASPPLPRKPGQASHLRGHRDHFIHKDLKAKKLRELSPLSPTGPNGSQQTDRTQGDRIHAVQVARPRECGLYEYDDVKGIAPVDPPAPGHYLLIPAGSTPTSPHW
jgi:hypothetical protein